MVEERIQVKGGAGRCPFCHDEVPREERVACVACLAAHHAGCWDEHGKCSSCGEAEALRRDAPALTPEPEPAIEVRPRAEEPAIRNPNLAPSDFVEDFASLPQDPRLDQGAQLIGTFVLTIFVVGLVSALLIALANAI